MASGTILSLDSVSNGTISKNVASGTFSQFACSKVGNIVNAGARIFSMSEPASGAFFVIPNGFRPTSDRTGYAYLVINGVEIPYICIVQPNGNVIIGYSPSMTATQFGFSITYPI